MENLRPLVADTLFPVEVSRYGLADGAPEYLLSDVYSFAVDHEGSVFIHDAGEGIRQYSVAGDFLGRVAGRGEGPGEVGYVVGMDAAKDGRIAAIDLRNRRVSVFARSSPPWSTRLPEGRPPYRDGAVVFGDDGSLWIGMNPLYPETGGITHPRAVFVRVDDGGALVDTVFTPGSIAYHCPILSSREHGAGFWDDSREPFVAKVKWALGRDGTFAVGCAASYRFYVYSPAGEVMRVARARPRVRVSREELDFRAAMPVQKAEETLPAYAKISLPGDGRIWIWPSQPSVKAALDPEVAERFGVTHTWTIPWQGAFDVFTAEGEWLAVVKLPANARYSGFPTEPGVVIRGDTLWAVEQGELDVQTVVRYQIPGLSPGG